MLLLVKTDNNGVKFSTARLLERHTNKGKKYTEVQLDRFEVFASGKWEADVTVTVYDHFGLDKLDALAYQDWHRGFASWWLLQHARGSVPFITKVIVRKQIITN